MSDKVINGQLPARISLGFRADNHLSFTGLDENRSLPRSVRTIAIRDLLEDIYADATPSDNLGIDKPRLGAHFQIRWTKQGGAKLRFYLATAKKLRPKFETIADGRTIKLRVMVQDAYDLARTKAQHAADEAEAAKPISADEAADEVLRSMGIDPKKPKSEDPS